jgi:hypothetical protein
MRERSQLILIDERPIRRGFLESLKKLQKTFLKLQAEIENHERVVRPAFQSWFQSRFAERIEILEKLRAELVRKASLVQRMRELLSFEGFSKKEAFQFASEELEFEERDEREAEQDEEEGFSGFEWSASEGEGFESERRTWFHDFEIHQPEPKKEEKTLKYYYRKLAQTLHPDRRSRASEFLDGLWHEMQGAYEAGDLEQMKFLWSVCLCESDPDSDELAVSDILEVSRDLTAKIKELQAEKRKLARTDPTWKFKKKSREMFAVEVGIDFNRAEQDLRDSLEELEREIREFSDPDRRRRSRRPRESVSF